MSTIYLISTQGKLSKKGETLVLRMDENTTKTIFPFKTEQLVLIGNIDLSTPALKFLMHRQIDTVFINKNGKYNGRLDFRSGKNIFLRIKQFERLKNENFRLKLAQSIVNAKLKNQLHFIQRIGRKRKPHDKITQAKEQINTLLLKVPTAASLDTLRGYEGAAARAYFSVYKQALLPQFARFEGRSMNPPQDNVNAVLSFLYTLILYRVDAALETEGLDPYAGYFHSIGYGKRSLSFDMMEEYRTPLADTLTVALFNLGILQEDDFREVVFSSEDDDFPLELNDEHEAFNEKKGVLLNRQGLRKVIAQFEKKLQTEIYFTPLQRRINYKQLIGQQMKHFKRVVNGEEENYKPLIQK